MTSGDNGTTAKLEASNELRSKEQATATSASKTEPAKTVWAVWVPILLTAAGLFGSAVTWGLTNWKSWDASIAEKAKSEKAENDPEPSQYQQGHVREPILWMNP